METVVEIMEYCYGRFVHGVCNFRHNNAPWRLISHELFVSIRSTLPTNGDAFVNWFYAIYIAPLCGWDVNRWFFLVSVLQFC